MQIELTKEQIEALMNAVAIAIREGLDTEEMVSACTILVNTVNNNQEFIKRFNKWLSDTNQGWVYTGTDPFKQIIGGNTRLASYMDKYAIHLGYADGIDLMEAEWIEEA